MLREISYPEAKNGEDNGKCKHVSYDEERNSSHDKTIISHHHSLPRCRGSLNLQKLSKSLLGRPVIRNVGNYKHEKNPITPHIKDYEF